MLLLVYCSVCLKPADTKVEAESGAPVVVTESNITTAAILK